jgi:hypothetical protein
VARKALIALIVAYAGPVYAEDRVAILVASESGAVPTQAMRKDAFALSETLFGMGFSVRRLENPSQTQLMLAINAVPDNATTLLFFSGEARREGDQTVLITGPDPVPLDATLAALAGQPSLVFLDTCRAGAVPLPAPAENPDQFLALPVAPDATCPTDAPSMAQDILARITAPSVAITEQFAAEGPWVRSTLTQPFVFRAASSATQLTAADYEMLERLSEDDRQKMIDLWTSSGIAVDVAGAPRVTATAATSPILSPQIIITAPVSPIIVQSAGVLSPITTVVSPIVTGAEVQGEELAILAAAPAARTGGLRPVPGAGGLPQPSVILGETATLVSLATPTPPPETPAVQLDYTDVAARTALKAADAPEYARLITTGAYDPAPELLPTAVQTELARMNCYTRTIDGQWGNGSRRALQLYFDTLKVAATTQEPTVEVFRQLLTADEVKCPDVVVAPTPARTATAPTTQRTTRRAAAPAAAAPAPAAPAPAPTTRTIRQTGTGTGAFR